MVLIIQRLLLRRRVASYIITCRFYYLVVSIGVGTERGAIVPPIFSEGGP